MNIKKKALSLWTSSPCSLGYHQSNIVIGKCERFSVGSIYYQDKIEGKDKIKLQIIRPESTLIDFRRRIEQCQKFHRLKIQSYSAKAAKSKSFFRRKQSNYSKKESEKVNLTQKRDQSDEVDRYFDKNGMRSTFYTTNGQEKIRYSFKKSKNNASVNLQKKFKGPKVYISGSTRIDLSKPQNFNPGPGSYFLDQRDNDHLSQFYQRSNQFSGAINKFQLKKSHEQSILSDDQNKKAKKSVRKNIKNYTQLSNFRRISIPKKCKTLYTGFHDQ